MISLDTLAHISELPGVYLFRDSKKQVIYIGKAKNLHKRVSQYFATGSLRKQDMMHRATDLEFMVCNNEADSLVLESNLIKQYQPSYNRLLK